MEDDGVVRLRKIDKLETDNFSFTYPILSLMQYSCRSMWCTHFSFDLQRHPHILHTETTVNFANALVASNVHVICMSISNQPLRVNAHIIITHP